MALTSLDDNAALVVIDLQVATEALPTQPTSAAEVVTRSAELAAAFRARELPVIVVTVGGAASGRTEVSAPGGELPENWDSPAAGLDVQPGDRTFVKYAWGAFHDGRLDELLAELKVGQVVLTGIATSIGVESTARAAYERNHHVVVVTDAVADMSSEAHEHSVATIFPQLGETATTAEVLERLARA